MVRKQIYIEPQHDALLKRLSKTTGVTEAELIRQAIEAHARSLSFRGRDLAAWDAERAFITRLIEAGPVPGRRTWQREDLHER